MKFINATFQLIIDLGRIVLNIVWALAATAIELFGPFVRQFVIDLVTHQKDHKAAEQEEADDLYAHSQRQKAEEEGDINYYSG